MQKVRVRRKITVRFRRDCVCVEELSLLVDEGDFAKVKEALNETVRVLSAGVRDTAILGG
jgi:hypothetical protein